MRTTELNTSLGRRKINKGKVVSGVQYWILVLPALIYILIFNYIPMFGTLIAFKDYRYNLGILGSEWVGFDNFKGFFTSQDAFIVTRNTVGYGLLFLVLKIMCAVLIAVLLYEINNKLSLKFYQTTMILPNFMSWVVVGYISYILLGSNGVFNGFLTNMGIEPIKWYSETKYWPYILSAFSVWKSVGMDSVVYYAALMGLDKAVFEAADIDGASKVQKTWYITIPSLIPTIMILLILGMGGIIKGDFGLFYQITGDSQLLYPVTDVIDTYVYRGIRTGDLGASSAVGLFQSVVGLILVVVTNLVVKKISPENSMF